MANVNGSFVSPSADATISPQLFYNADALSAVLTGFTFWKALATLFFAAVIYDQRKQDPIRLCCNKTGA
jgi:C-22 sterol desaturase